MKRYSQERKESVLGKMAPPHNRTVAELSREEGISEATLYNWRKQARSRGAILPSNSNPPDKWSSDEKFRIVVETAPLNASEFSAYCRRHGLYPEQVEAWRAACEQANAEAGDRDQKVGQQRKGDRKRIRKLERELGRKEKALAETAALLTLSKKAEAIWGHNDEDA